METKQTKKKLGFVSKKKPVATENPEYKKLVLYFVIIDAEQSDSLVKFMQSFGSSLQIRHLGSGTASKQVLDVLGVERNKKSVIASVFKEESISDFTKELEAFFTINKKNRGVGFSIPLTSMVGVKLYHFLTNTL